MESKAHDGNFVQCQYCGNIYYTEQEIPIDQLMVNIVCPKCKYGRALNCGESKEDIYLYMNESIDPNFYLY